LKINGITMQIEGDFYSLAQDSSVTTADTNTSVEQQAISFPNYVITLFTFLQSLKIRKLHSR